jgi:RNA polymerase-binding transcription factor DksA
VTAAGHRRRLSVLAAVLAGLPFVAGCPGKLGGQQGHAPAQPIAFSHAIHAGLYELDCQYCHAGAERSRHAGVPTASVCMNCHTQVKIDSPEIVKLTALVKSNQPIPWVKVHRLPDFAFFSHASHIAGGLQCQTCHGPVQQMVRVEQVETMTMGWCLRCHREIRDQQREAPVPLATLALNLLGQGPEGPGHVPPPPVLPPRQLAPPTDCSGCHR